MPAVAGELDPLKPAVFLVQLGDDLPCAVFGAVIHQENPAALRNQLALQQLVVLDAQLLRCDGKHFLLIVTWDDEIDAVHDRCPFAKRRNSGQHRINHARQDFLRCCSYHCIINFGFCQIAGDLASPCLVARRLFRKFGVEEFLLAVQSVVAGEQVADSDGK